MSEPHFIFIGSTTDKDGATTRIKAGGESYRKKLLSSKPENWMVIADMIRDEGVKGALVTLTGHDYKTGLPRVWLTPDL